MNNIDIRKYIINNFKDDSLEDIKTSIDKSINKKEEETLIGLGVLFELYYNSLSDKEKSNVINTIRDNF